MCWTIADFARNVSGTVTVTNHGLSMTMHQMLLQIRPLTVVIFQTAELGGLSAEQARVLPLNESCDVKPKQRR
jgi:hypothetical protein